jgi:pimeloyl-ACP methyl ester carboxylesterase
VDRRRQKSCAGALVALVVAVGCSSAHPKPLGDHQRSSPPVESQSSWHVGSELVHLDCMGTGSPTVLLLAGAGDASSTWDRLPRSGIRTRSCAYSYPGVEDSTTPGGWMTARRAVSTLEAVLRVAGEPGPYVVVGHSIAGLETQLFVGERASQVRGVVLFDPTSPLFAASRAGALLRGANWLPKLSARQDAVVTHWPDVPVRIFGHDVKQYKKAAPQWTTADERIWRRGQHAMARLSPHGRYQIVKGAGHYIYVDRPELSLAAINDLVDQARASGQ